MLQVIGAGKGGHAARDERQNQNEAVGGSHELAKTHRGFDRDFGAHVLGIARLLPLSGTCRAHGIRRNVSSTHRASSYTDSNRPGPRMRCTSSDEVASLVAYVCSELASATTGAALRVDGGVVRSIA